MIHQRYLSCAVIVLGALLASPRAASAAEITGKVVLSGKPSGEVVVSIEGLRVEGAAEPMVYVIDHRNLNFVPHVLVVRAGLTVQFKNSDGMPCRIYSISPAGAFVLGQRDGKPMTMRFDRAGVIELRCADHSRIYAFIVIKENPYFALTSFKGQYKITKVPAGRYTLQAWYEGNVIESKTIEIGDAKLKVDFKAARPESRGVGEKPKDLESVFSAADSRPDDSPELSTLWRK